VTAGGRLDGMKRLVVCFAMLAGLVAGCSSGGAHPDAGASPSSGADQQRALAIGRQFVQCARQHGQPGFPDPVWQAGSLQFGSAGDQVKDQIRQLPHECISILELLPASGHRKPPPTAEDLRRLAQFAQCLRQHGMPEWPDPKSDGTFPLRGTPLEAEGKSQRMLDAIDACSQYWDKAIEGS
jgi:hypothetical protein